MKNNRGHKIQNETLGFLWLTLCILTSLSLFSYDPNDTGFFSTHPNHEISNFVGPVGAYWSGGLFMLLGVGAYMVPAVMFVTSLAMFLQKEIEWLAKLLWCSVYFFSLSCLLDLQSFVGRGLNLPSPGGVVGSTMDDFFTKILGNGGWTLLMVALFIVATIFLFGLHPVKLAQEFQFLYQQWKEEREEKRLLESGEEGELELKRRRLKEQMERIKRSISQDEAEQATPQVIDSSARETRAEKKAKEARELKEEKVKEEKAKPPAPVIDATRNTPTRAPEKKKEIPAVSRVLNVKDYQFPGKELLEAAVDISLVPTNEKELQANSALLVAKLKEFGIDCAPGTITKGTTITRYELFPAPGVRVDRIKSVQNDIALAMKAERVNILAPIPGKDTVGVEIPNISKVAVRLKDLFESDAWVNSKARIPLAIGKDIYGGTMIADLAEMPHLLVAGTTGSGKSVVINCIILSLLYRFSPEDLKLILVDPKVVEMQMFNPIPHLITDVVTEPKNVLKALRQVVFEMERRYQILAKVGVKNIVNFNNRPKSTKPVEAPAPEATLEPDEDLFGEKLAPKTLEIPEKLSYWVVIIDELADLMQTASAEVEALIARITQKARAAGIHLIVATQTPRREVVTGVIKANIPSRIALQVASGIDSRVILDDLGAENLLGKGDLLYLAPGAAKSSRGQGAFVSEEEVHRVIDFIAAQIPADRNSELHQKLNSNEEEQEPLDEESLERLKHCYQIMRAEKKISASFVQRRMSIGYNTAARLIEVLEKRGVIGEADANNPARPREILIDLENPPKWLL
ncbi:MAG: DNA translocase FtsK 4TM domain-containing protein [Verrucomicrobiota bacterium]